VNIASQKLFQMGVSRGVPLAYPTPFQILSIIKRRLNLLSSGVDKKS
jgi:hypothetical protein